MARLPPGRGAAVRANPGRVAAARALVRVDEGQHLEDALGELLPQGPDRALGWFLAFGVMRHRARVDAALRPHLRQPIEVMDAPVRAVLRLGAFEKLHARTRPHAVVHQAVEVTRALSVGRASGLVNAVLRRVTAHDELSRAERLDHPAWLVARWDARYGPEATERWCLANAEPPPLTIVLRDASVLERLREAGLELSPARAGGRTIDDAWRVEGHTGPVPSLPGFEEGHLWVQDASSVLVADLVGAGEGSRVLDACAAPGGKTFRMASRGAHVTSVDVSETRLARIAEGARRLGLPVELRTHDWTRGPLAEAGQFDAVLVDAPCTGLGTVRRHPEIRWRRVESDIPHAAARQKVFLEHASVHVRPGGVLVYAVCSAEPEEGEDIVREFLRAHPEFVLEEQVVTAPPTDDEDAFQAARLRRSM